MHHNTVEIQWPLKTFHTTKLLKAKHMTHSVSKRRLWPMIYEIGEDGFNLIHVKQLFRGLWTLLLLFVFFWSQWLVRDRKLSPAWLLANAQDHGSLFEPWAGDPTWGPTTNPYQSDSQIVGDSFDTASFDTLTPLDCLQRVEPTQG